MRNSFLGSPGVPVMVVGLLSLIACGGSENIESPASTTQAIVTPGNEPHLPSTVPPAGPPAKPIAANSDYVVCRNWCYSLTEYMYGDDFSEDWGLFYFGCVLTECKDLPLNCSQHPNDEICNPNPDPEEPTEPDGEDDGSAGSKPPLPPVFETPDGSNDGGTGGSNACTWTCWSESIPGGTQITCRCD